MLDLNGNTPPKAVRQPRRSRGLSRPQAPIWERADLAAKAYAQGRPIEAPTLQQVAVAYRVSVASVQRRLNGKHVTVDLAVASWRSWTPAQRAEFGRGAGVADVWDYAIIPTITEERQAAEAAE